MDPMERNTLIVIDPFGYPLSLYPGYYLLYGMNDKQTTSQGKVIDGATEEYLTEAGLETYTSLRALVS